MPTIDDTVRIHGSLKAEAERLAESDGTTLAQFVNVAVAEKIAALKTLDYLKQRATRGSAAEALGILAEAGNDDPVQPGDERPSP
jgi:hypothetical protein